MYLLMFGLLAELALAFFLSRGDYFRPSVIVSGIMYLFILCMGFQTIFVHDWPPIVFDLNYSSTGCDHNIFL